MAEQKLKLDRHGGHEPPEMDDTPIEMPLGYRVPTPLSEFIARSVRLAIENEKGQEFDSLEDADDFEEEDPETLDLSRYELDELQHETADVGSLLEPEPDPLPPSAEPEPAPSTDPPAEEPSQ
jgi:hypothetical protein